MYHLTELKDFAELVKFYADTRGFVPEDGDDWRAMTYDVWAVQRRDGDDGQELDLQHLDCNWWPWLLRRAKIATALARAKLGQLDAFFARIEVAKSMTSPDVASFFVRSQDPGETEADFQSRMELAAAIAPPDTVLIPFDWGGTRDAEPGTVQSMSEKIAGMAEFLKELAEFSYSAQDPEEARFWTSEAVELANSLAVTAKQLEGMTHSRREVAYD
jgi:hypothetical protein